MLWWLEFLLRRWKVLCSGRKEVVMGKRKQSRGEWWFRVPRVLMLLLPCHPDLVRRVSDPGTRFWRPVGGHARPADDNRLLLVGLPPDLPTLAPRPAPAGPALPL